MDRGNGFVSAILDSAGRPFPARLELREDPSWQNLTAQGWGNFNARAAENLSSVFACVDVISSALSSLPPRLYENTGTERREVADDPVLGLFREPNRWQTWPDFMQWYIAECLLFGNAVAIVQDGELWPSRWQATGTMMLSTGRIRYDWQVGDGAFNRHGMSMDDAVLHMRDRTDDGFIGRSRLSRVAATVGLAHDVMDAAIGLWQNGAFPSGAVKLQGRVSPEERTRLREQLSEQFSGAGNRAKVMVLDQGSEWESMATDPHDAETLETRRFMVAEICRIFEVPPPLIQSYEFNTFTNSQEASRWFSNFTLAGWARKFEAAFARTLLPESQSLELDMSSFTRADHGERWAAHKIALETGVLQPDEVRRLEGI